jgi:hypothetical protein
MPRTKKQKVKNFKNEEKPVNCGCCAGVIKSEKQQHLIKPGEQEIYNLLFNNFKVK